MKSSETAKPLLPPNFRWLVSLGVVSIVAMGAGVLYFTRPPSAVTVVAVAASANRTPVQFDVLSASDYEECDRKQCTHHQRRMHKRRDRDRQLYLKLVNSVTQEKLPRPNKSALSGIN